MSVNEFFEISLRVFFLLTPFCVMSVFLSMTAEMDTLKRRSLALRTTFAIAVLVLLFFFAGKHLFVLFGITLDAFKAGAGAILFVSALSLVTGKVDMIQTSENDDIAVVPLAIPLAVGPGTIGALMVMSVSIEGVVNTLIVSLSLLLSVLSTGLLIIVADRFKDLLGSKVLAAFSRSAGLILGALSAQLIFDGVRGFVASLGVAN